jgi:hypothetical protein
MSTGDSSGIRNAIREAYHIGSKNRTADLPEVIENQKQEQGTGTGV